MPLGIATGAFFQKSKKTRKSVKKCPLALRPLSRPLRTLQGGLAPPSRRPSPILSRIRSGPRRDPAARRGQNRAGGRARSGPPPAHPSGAPSPRTPLAAPYASSGRGADIAARTEPPKKGVLAPPRRFHGARDWRRGSLKAGGRSPHEAGALPETNESVIGGPLAARRASMAGGAGRSGAAEKGGPEGAVRVGRGARGAQAGCATPARAVSGT